MISFDKDTVESVARRIAALKMGLVKDKWGERLPDDLWRQCIPAAIKALQLNESNK